MLLKKFTSESVTEGHPDKLADKLSDAFLDFSLSFSGGKKRVKAAIETMFTGKYVIIAGEVSEFLLEKVKKESQSLVGKVLRDVGYSEDSFGMSFDEIKVIEDINPQTGELAKPHDFQKDEEVSGDQGMMCGFACLDTDVWMPAAISWSHDLAKKLTELRKKNILPWLRPDGKTQVTVAYKKGIPFVDTVVLSTQHDENVDLDFLRNELQQKVVNDVLSKHLTNDSKFCIQESGSWSEGGPVADTGLTGRKITVDTYGGYVPNGGGAFSGKDPTKVDRSGAYYARFAAVKALEAFKNKELNRVEIQVAYAIHQKTPISFFIKTNRSDLDQEVGNFVKSLNWDLSNINKKLDLWNRKYEPLSSYGHFGRKDLNLPWDPSVN